VQADKQPLAWYTAEVFHFTYPRLKTSDTFPSFLCGVSEEEWIMSQRLRLRALDFFFYAASQINKLLHVFVYWRNSNLSLWCVLAMAKVAISRRIVVMPSEEVFFRNVTQAVGVKLFCIHKILLLIHYLYYELLVSYSGLEETLLICWIPVFSINITIRIR
jgi:hypothetical protein